MCWALELEAKGLVCGCVFECVCVSVCVCVGGRSGVLGTGDTQASKHRSTLVPFSTQESAQCLP